MGGSCQLPANCFASHASHLERRCPVHFIVMEQCLSLSRLLMFSLKRFIPSSHDDQSSKQSPSSKLYSSTEKASISCLPFTSHCVVHHEFLMMALYASCMVTTSLAKVSSTLFRYFKSTFGNESCTLLHFEPQKSLLMPLGYHERASRFLK